MTHYPTEPFGIWYLLSDVFTEEIIAKNLTRLRCCQESKFEAIIVFVQGVDLVKWKSKTKHQNMNTSLCNYRYVGPDISRHFLFISHAVNVWLYLIGPAGFFVEWTQFKPAKGGGKWWARFQQESSALLHFLLMSFLIRSRGIKNNPMCR